MDIPHEPTSSIPPSPRSNRWTETTPTSGVGGMPKRIFRGWMMRLQWKSIFWPTFNKQLADRRVQLLTNLPLHVSHLVTKTEEIPNTKQKHGNWKSTWTRRKIWFWLGDTISTWWSIWVTLQLWTVPPLLFWNSWENFIADRIVLIWSSSFTYLDDRSQDNIGQRTKRERRSFPAFSIISTGTKLNNLLGPIWSRYPPQKSRLNHNPLSPLRDLSLRSASATLSSPPQLLHKLLLFPLCLTTELKLTEKERLILQYFTGTRFYQGHLSRDPALATLYI